MAELKPLDSLSRWLDRDDWRSPETTSQKRSRVKCPLAQGDTAKAKTAYRDFLTLWKDADPDIPILKQAKAEDAKLQ